VFDRAKAGVAMVVRNAIAPHAVHSPHCEARNNALTPVLPAT
jgi:hypothetical protein